MKEQDAYQEVFSSSYAEDLEPMAQLLSENGIDYQVEALGSEYNPYLMQGRQVDAVRLLVPMSQFALAKEILIASGHIGDVSEEEGYRQMLGGLDNDELYEMVVEAPRYPAMQVKVARVLLAERGMAIDEEQVEETTTATIDAQRQPLGVSPGWRIAWILFSVIGAPVALIFSIAALTMTGRDLHGRPYPMYDDATKALAKILLWVSIFMSVAFILVRVIFIH